MEFKIEKKEEKPLVERIEIIIKARDFEATPSNAQFQEEVSKQLKKPAEVVVVKRIHQKFGKSEAQALVYVYNSKEALDRFEPKPKKKKKPKEKKEEKPEEVAEAAPAKAPAPEEKPIEKPKEKPAEKPEEKKKEETKTEEVKEKK